MNHLLQSLQSAAKLAVAHGNTVSDIRIDHWASTYRATSEDVRKAFDTALARASLMACPQTEFEGK